MTPFHSTPLKASLSSASGFEKSNRFVAACHQAPSCKSFTAADLVVFLLAHSGISLGSTGGPHKIPGRIGTYGRRSGVRLGWLRHQGNVAKPPKLAQTGWFPSTNPASSGFGTTPARLIKHRRATPPNLGGEFPFGCLATFL